MISDPNGLLAKLGISLNYENIPKPVYSSNLLEAQSLIKLLKEYDDAYFNDDPLVSDTEYDVLKSKLQELDPTNEYFQNVGAPVRNKKVKLPYPMGSLNQRYPDDIERWVKDYNLQTEETFASHKLDGVSGLLIYRNNVFYKAYSRGDGYEGQDITKHVKLVPSLPAYLHSKDQFDEIAIRVELIMKREIFSQNHSIEFKNPRNLVAGIFNRKESEENILKDIDIVAYEIVHMSHSNLLTKTMMLSTLKDFGFKVVEYVSYLGSQLTPSLLENMIIEAKRKSSYELDGVVITVNNWQDLEERSKSQSLNPEHSIKYKILDTNTIKETDVVKVHWELKKSGYWKPTVEIVPVNIGGVTITYATGFNAGFIVSNNVGTGAKVKITRSGDVIPYIMAVPQPGMVELPEENCEWTKDAKGNQVELISKDKNNPKIVFEQVLDFVKSIDVELLKDASLRELFDKFDWNGQPYTAIIGTLFDLTEAEFVKVIGANGKKIYASLHRRLQNMNIVTLIGSLNYCGIGFGVRKARQLLDQISWDELTKLTDHSPIVDLHGFDEKTATNIFNGIPQLVKFIERFKDYIIFKEEEKISSALEGLNVVMTGFRDADLQKKIEAMGGKVSSGVSGKTTHLLAVDTSGGSTKLQKAREKGVAVMTPDQFKDQFNL